jgi:hypothetical protein
MQHVPGTLLRCTSGVRAPGSTLWCLSCLMTTSRGAWGVLCLLPLLLWLITCHASGGVASGSGRWCVGLLAGCGLVVCGCAVFACCAAAGVAQLLQTSHDTPVYAVLFHASRQLLTLLAHCLVLRDFLLQLRHRHGFVTVLQVLVPCSLRSAAMCRSWLHPTYGLYGMCNRHAKC